jgi:hypothetical protein
MAQVANQVVKLRQEGERLTGNQLAQGVVLVFERRQATAATYKSGSRLSSGQLGIFREAGFPARREQISPFTAASRRVQAALIRVPAFPLSTALPPETWLANAMWATQRCP